jgi:hypothetical protein
MAKKTTKKKPATKAKKKAPAKKVERVEIELDPVETKAFELAHSSVEVCTELEEAVTSAISQAVQKVFKGHRISLKPLQAQEVALLLFGD